MYVKDPVQVHFFNSIVSAVVLCIHTCALLMCQLARLPKKSFGGIPCHTYSMLAESAMACMSDNVHSC